jgi:hypothetical protein|tara:strand:- start:60 stop:245 length:186 start_codon:yes stop_codon:yes gene_type:complete
MSDEEVKEFMQSFDHFMNHADVEIQGYLRREAVRKHNLSCYESEAAKLELTLDYYMDEFVV